MDDAYVGLMDNSSTVMGMFSWGSGGKTFKAVRVGASNKVAVRETGVVGGLGVVYSVQLMVFGGSLCWEPRSMVRYWWVCQGCSLDDAECHYSRHAFLYFRRFRAIRGDLRCTRLFGGWLRERDEWIQADHCFI